MSPPPPGLLGQVSIVTDAGPVQVSALSIESLADADGPAEISAGAETGASLEMSLGLLEEVAGAAGAGNGMILLSIAGLNEDATSSLATDDVRAEPGARRLASTASVLRSRPISINFRSADGTKINVQNLTTPMKMRLKVEDPNATCAYWDESAAQWSSEGVQTLSSEEPGFIQCSTTHLSIFAGVMEVILQNVLLLVDCSTLGLLIQLEALEKLMDGEWFGRPAAWMPGLMAVVFGILLGVAAWVDECSIEELPLEEREDLLFRRGVAAGGLIRRGCLTYICGCAGNSIETRPVTAGRAQRVLQAIRPWALELLAFARRSLHWVVHYSIGLLVAHRSAIDRDTAYILQTALSNWAQVEKNQVPAGAAPSNAENAENANRGSRTTETSFPGEMRRPRITLRRLMPAWWQNCLRSNAENAENANRGSRTTETSGRETVPGEMRRQRNTQHFVQESIHEFHAPRTSLTKARELNRGLGSRGAVAATQFLNVNLLMRVELLFPAVHDWFALNQFSIARSHVTRVALLSMKVFSGCAFDAVLFSSTAEPGFNDEKPECSPALASWKYVGQAVITGLASTLLSDVVIWILSYILSATIEERPAWTTKDWSARLRWSRWRTRCFLCFAASYDLACLIYVYLFIANAREGDSTQLMLAILWGLFQDGLGKPLVMAAILAIASSLALWLFPEISGEVGNKWPEPKEDASESRPATRPGPPSSQPPE
ncbi:unnamed protein product, partial [Cladocopium goreaui]